MTHAAIETVNGAPAYRVDVGGVWKHFRTAVCVDHGGNVYQSRTAPKSTCGLAAAGPRGVSCRVSYRDEVEAGLTETTPITAETTVDEISAYLIEREVEHTRTADGAITFEAVHNGRRVYLYQHGDNEHEIAGLWAYNVVGDCSDGLDSMEDIAWLIS